MVKNMLLLQHVSFLLQIQGFHDHPCSVSVSFSQYKKPEFCLISLNIGDSANITLIYPEMQAILNQQLLPSTPLTASIDGFDANALYTHEGDRVSFAIEDRASCVALVIELEQILRLIDAFFPHYPPAPLYA